MYTALVAIQVLVSLALIAFVLLQQGKGADAGAAFGAGASGTVFGARGSANFFSRATAVCAVLFMTISLALAYLVNDMAQADADSVVERMADEPDAERSGMPAVPEDEAPVSGGVDEGEGARPSIPE
ncbi:preprotein translocase subunit SecG [Algiphilus sp.]|uniref:preprotein translocase subunit SecG n=1 Tax=Algiphilus sp. TaxID=1872431 RepID=UPI002A5DA70C|nr:preprotein translocase subunit SecG [Pseudomonadota bacterium]